MKIKIPEMTVDRAITAVKSYVENATPENKKEFCRQMIEYLKNIDLKAI